jgi:hypothetical protein
MHVNVRCCPLYAQAAWHMVVAWPSYVHVHAPLQLPPAPEPPPVPPLPGTVQVDGSVDVEHEKPLHVVPVPRYFPLQLLDAVSG